MTAPEHDDVDVDIDGDPLEDTGSHAADEPTAMWDQAALRELGLDAPQEQEARGPATQGTGRHRAVGVELAQEESGRRPKKAVEQKPSKSSGLAGWVLTAVIAVALGVAMFYLVRSFQ
ncbi:MAG: hypothetical protein AAF411_24005 [Myxococcota bacterium]